MVGLHQILTGNVITCLELLPNCQCRFKFILRSNTEIKFSQFVPCARTIWAIVCYQVSGEPDIAGCKLWLSDIVVDRTFTSESVDVRARKRSSSRKSLFAC